MNNNKTRKFIYLLCLIQKDGSTHILDVFEEQEMAESMARHLNFAEELISSPSEIMNGFAIVKQMEVK